MSPSRLALVVSFFLGAHPLVAPQTETQSPPPATSAQGAAVLQKALAALAPSTPITDITLSGTARRIAGSDDETGTVVIKALAGTGSRMDLTLPSGPRSEIRNLSAVNDPTGSWSGPDGVSHAISYHNLLTDAGWSPAFTIASLLSVPNAVITYIGSETKNGQSVIHVSASQTFPTFSADPTTAKLMQHLTQTDIFLDPSTSLPVSIAFATHADGNALLDIPIEIDFSSYQTVSGSPIPFHIQRFMNNSLSLDLQFESATLNSGLSSSTFLVGGAQ